MASSLVDLYYRPADVFYKEGYSISGTVTKQSSAVDRKVLLFSRIGFLKIRGTVSDPDDGSYSFSDISNDYKYFVMVFDHLLDCNAEVEDNVTSVAD